MSITRDKHESAVHSEENFTLGKGFLRAKRDLYWEYLEEFEAACARLLESRVSRLRVDLSEVNFISSSFVGCLGNFVYRASRRRKKVNLRVTMDTSWLFDIMGDQKIVELEVV